MQRVDNEADDAGASGSPRASDSPPVGEGLVVSRRRPPVEQATTPAPVPTGPLAGQLGLVTGAAGELGAAFADVLAGRGARVVLVDADLAALRRTASGLSGQEPALLLRCDLGSTRDVAAACDFLDKAGARVDLVVHAAAAPASAPVVGGAIDDLDEQYLIGVRAPTLLVHELAPSMASGASVVFVDRDPDPDDGPAGGQRAVLAAARRELADVLRSELHDHDVRLLAASCALGVPPAEVADAVVDLAVRPGPTRVTAVRVEAGPPSDADDGGGEDHTGG